MIINGDCIEVLKGLESNSVDAEQPILKLF